MSAATTIKRDGSVLVNGRVIGRLESRPQQSIAAAIMGTESTRKEWRGVSTDGVLSTPWVEKRDRAVQTLRDVTAAPTVSEFTKGVGWMSTGEYVHASLRWQGHYFSVSSYEHEIREDGSRLWVVDSYFAPGAWCPAWSNGEGTRVTAAKCLQGELETLVTDAFKVSGVTF